MISFIKEKGFNEANQKAVLELFQQLKIELEEAEHDLMESEDLKIDIPWSSENDIEKEDSELDYSLLTTILDRVRQTLRQYIEVLKVTLKKNENLQEELEYFQLNFNEIQMERDVLLTRVHSYLEENSSLKCRLEEQRCQRVPNQRQEIEDFEVKIKALELDNKKLYDGIIEKGKEILDLNITMEETRKLLKIKEVEVSNLRMDKTKEVADLKKDFDEVLAEKTKLEEENKKLLELICSREVGKKKRIRREKKTIRRCRSAEDVDFISSQNGSSDFLFPNRCRFSANGDCSNGSQISKVNSSTETESFLRRELKFSRKQPNSEQSQTSNGRKFSTDKESTPKIGCKNEEKKYVKPEVKYPEPALDSQLNDLRHGLINVTEKLKVLKSQLMDPVSTIVDTTEDEKKSRNLKRKAEPLENHQVSENVIEQSKSDVKNVRDILEDAKNLNAKLQILREVIVTGKEENGRVCFEGKYEHCRTVEKNEGDDDNDDDVDVETPLIFRYFGSTIIKLKKAVSDCEKMLDEGLLSKDEAFANLVSAFSTCIMSNLRYFHESEKRALNSLEDEIDTKSLMDEELNKSREESSEEKENGGGDNLLKMEIAPDGREEYKELKIQIARLKFQIERFPIFQEA